MEKLKILMLEDSPADAGLIQYELKKGGINFIAKIVETKTDFENALKDFDPDVVLSDHSLPQFNSLMALRMHKEYNRKGPFILVTGTVSEEFAVQTIMEGADDYILKDKLTRLPSAIAHALKTRQAIQEKEKAFEEIMRKNVHMDQIMNSQPVVLYIAKARAEYGINFISENVKNITGYTAAKMMDDFKIWYGNIHPKDVVRVFKNRITNIELGGGNVEYRWKCEDGSWKWFLDNFTVVKEKNAEEYIYGAWVDITMKKNAELRKLEYSKGLEKMLFMMSHEVRHSITQIQGLSNLLDETANSEEEIKEIVGHMKVSTLSLDMFTRELTTLMDDLKKQHKNEPMPNVRVQIRD